MQVFSFIYFILNFYIYLCNNFETKYCGPQKFFNEICVKKNIIVSMTSWPKRIGNLIHVLKTLINQEVQPDLIEINLSLVEFPNKEDNLPLDLKKYIKQNKNIEINWVEKNTGVFKKIIPTIKKFYGMDYYLLSVDDDWLYRNDYIQMMINYIEIYKSDSFCLGGKAIIGSVMIYKSSCFDSDFYEKLTEEIINARISDLYIIHYLKSKHKIIEGVRPKKLFYYIIFPFNQIYPNSLNNGTGQYSSQQIKKSINLIKKIKFDI